MFFIDIKSIQEGPPTVKAQSTKEIMGPFILKSGSAMEKPSKFAAGDNLVNIYETGGFCDS